MKHDSNSNSHVTFLSVFRILSLGKKTKKKRKKKTDSLPSIGFLHITVSMIKPGEGFKDQGHYTKVL